MAYNSDRTFGKRIQLANSPRPETSDSNLVRVKKDIGTSPYIFGAALAMPLAQILPRLSHPSTIIDTLTHSGELYTFCAGLGWMAIIYVLARNPSNLEINSSGITLINKSGHWFYNWRDIDGADEVKGGIRLRLHGRTDAQNKPNVISTRFGFSPAQLSSIISTGMADFKSSPSFHSAKTVSPGDDLEATEYRSNREALKNIAYALCVGFPLLLVWAASDFFKISQLQSHGRSTTASVTRIYEADCAKRGCSIYAEYAFFAAPSGGNTTQYHGYGIVGSSERPNGPDLVHARTDRVIPIAYDVRDPSVSEPNFNNRVFNERPLSRWLTILEITGGIVLLTMMLAALPMWKALYRRYGSPLRQ